MMQTAIYIIFIILHLVLIIGLLVIIAKIVPIIIYFHTQLPYVPTQRSAIRKVVHSKHLQNAQHVIDLGAGTGVFMRILARHYKGTQFTGVEIMKPLVLLGKLYALTHRNVRLHGGDMFAYDISQADAIIGFWIPELLPKIVAKLESEATPGTIIVSNMFALPTSSRLRGIDVLRTKKQLVYVYTITAAPSNVNDSAA